MQSFGYVILMAMALSVPVPAQGMDDVAGLVMDKNGEGLPYASVKVIGHPYGEVTDLDGRFKMRVPAGAYVLEASMIGYAPGQTRSVRVDSGAVVNVKLTLEERMLSLSAITVTPGRFSIMQTDPTVAQTLTREDIESIPQFGEDIYRAVTRLPGISSNDFSATFTVRGGEHDEVFVSLDGLEIFDPFHLKDINGGALSIVDVHAIGGIDLMTGGFPVQYGGHLSGVFNISTIDPRAKRQTSVGISLMNARVMNEGKGSWLVSVRRGYLDLVLSLMNEEGVEHKYYDVLGKVGFKLNESHTLSTHVLTAGDNLLASEDEDTATTSYNNSYLWQRLNSTFGDRVAAETVWSFSRITHKRSGADLSVKPIEEANGIRYVDEVNWHVEDERTFTVLGLRQDWNWDAGDHFVSLGVNAKRLDAEYDYFNRDRFFETVTANAPSQYDTTQVSVSLSGHELGLSLSDRFRIAPNVTAEVGIRFDDVSYADDSDFSPRASLVFNPTSRTAIRGSWGLYRQSQGIHEMDVQYGDQVFYPSEQSKHRVIGFEHVFAKGTQLRVEGYQKLRSKVRPRYENLSKDVLFFPELETQRLFLLPERAESKGIELYLKRDVGKKLSFWTSYALAWSEETVGGVDFPKNADQRHTFYVDANYRPNAKWRVNAAWQYRSGWPYSEQFFVRRTAPRGVFQFARQYGTLNAKRFPAYHRLDLRVNRVFNTKRGRLSVFVEGVNL